MIMIWPSRVPRTEHATTALMVAGVLAGIVGLDIALPGSYTAMGLFVVVPSLAALRPCSPRRTALIGAATLAVVVPLAAVQWESRPGVGFTSVLGTASPAVMMWIVCRRQQRGDSAQAGLREIAEAAQRAVLRPVPRRLGPVRAQVRYLAAAARARVGGDLYDVVSTPYGVRIVIGDVMGKGLDAVGKAADVLGAFRELAHHEKSLPGMAERLDAFLSTSARDGEFVTALLVEIPEGAGSAELLSCGHPPPMLLSGGRVTFADAPSPAPPLGLLRMADGCFPSSAVRLGPGDRLLLYTDGVSEARDASGAFYPLADRVRAMACDDPHELMERLENDLRGHAGGRLQDDAALLLLQFDQAAVPAGRWE